MTTSRLDRVDLQILGELQGNARLSSAYQARLDPAKLGYQVTAFVHISLDKKDTRHLQEPWPRIWIVMREVKAPGNVPLPG